MTSLLSQSGASSPKLADDSLSNTNVTDAGLTPDVVASLADGVMNGEPVHVPAFADAGASTNGDVANVLESASLADLEASVAWMRARINIAGYIEDAWTTDHTAAVHAFLLNAATRRLFVFLDGEDLRVQAMQPSEQPAELTYFVRTGAVPVVPADIATSVQFGTIHGNVMESLLRLMNGVYVPVFMGNRTWPESIKKEFSAQLHKFMASLTETAHQMRGSTVLYIPAEETGEPDRAAKEKDLVQRLESALIHWTRQIKEVLNNQENSEMTESSGPLAEIAFWRSRCIDLSGIREQLDRPGVRRIVAVLEHAKSSYLPPFLQLSSEIMQGSAEAQDNLKFLSTLQESCDDLARADPEAIPDILPGLLNCIRLIWSISRFYNTAERLTGLLRKVSNEIINRCCARIDLHEVFDGDVERSMVDLQQSITAGEAWKQIYRKTTTAIARHAARTGASAVWDFDESSIFAQVDAFVQRCRDLLEVCEGQIQFARKKRGTTVALPAFGGARGPEIAKSLLDIQASFEKHIGVLRNLNYNILDVKATRWHDDYNRFKHSIKDLEVMMQNVITSAFESISTTVAGVELLEVFDSLAKREAIRRTVEKKTADIFALFMQDLNKVKKDFDQFKKLPPLDQSFPPCAGAAMWARGLLGRVATQMAVLDDAHYLVSTREADEARAGYTQLQTALEEYVRKTYGEWITSLDGGLAKNLETPLMVRTEEGRLESNFDKTLLQLFQEVHYWEKLQYEIPYAALEITQQGERLRVLRENVMLVVRDYNSILTALNKEERALFQERIQHLDRKINPGLSKLHWTGKGGIDTFLRDSRKNANDVYGVVRVFKNTHLQITRLCAQIADTLLLDIEKKKVYQQDEFMQRQAAHRQRMAAQLEETYDSVKQVMVQMYDVFKNDSEDVQNQWVKFTLKIDRMIGDALRQTVKRSLQEISRAIAGDGKNEIHPLFTVDVELEQQTVEFRPTMTSLIQVTNHVVKDLITTVSVVPRLMDRLQVEDAISLSPEQQEENSKRRSFYDVISNDDDILKILVGIKNGMNSNVEEMGRYLDTWKKYASIWELDKDAFIRRYAKGNRPLSAFESVITQYQEKQREIVNEESITDIHFIRIDCSPLKHALAAHCNAWQNKFTGLLNSIASDELHALQALFARNTAALKEPPKNLAVLGEKLELTQKLQQQKETIEARFEPLRLQFAALERFEVQVSVDDTTALASLDQDWLAFQQQLSSTETMLDTYKERFKTELLHSVDDFTKQVVAMRDDFQIKAPFESVVSVERANEIIGEFTRRIDQMRNKENQLRAGLSIFSIDQPMYKDIAATAKDVELLKQIWAFTAEWNKKWVAWKDGQFLTLDIQSMEENAATFYKRCVKLGREIKGWEVYQSLKENVDQFKRTMPLLLDLKNQAMRDRHWEQLREEVGKSFDPNDKNFTLENVLAWGFDQHAEFISTLSASASKELSIETALSGIDEAWASVTLDVDKYKDKDHHRLKSADEIFTILEDHQVTLSTMKASRYYVAFEQDVEKWEKTLSHVLETIEMLLQVQRQWMYLESIFAGSEDIRRQMPQESKIFDSVNSNWRFVMDRVRDDPNALRATHTDGLLELLGKMNTNLERIQKSLDQYLETKRQAFPRFYFLSNDDLLEILGQAKDPNAVQGHMKKCFDNIKRLELAPPGKDGRRFTEAVAMESSDGEVVPFVTPVVADGPVEAWLTNVEAAMRASLKKVLWTAVSAMRRTKREKAVKDLPGQLLITIGQVQWTADTARALADIEKGDKNALRQLKRKQIALLNKYSEMVRGQLTKLQRLKLNALVIIEVHGRDVLDRMIKANCSTTNDFDWLSQLRFYWDKDEEDCVARQTNTRFLYGYEYIGNSGRLVITPLTDRCYLTLTTALHLHRGGAPQGPAGTGKTETVKDLGKAIATYVIVFNCSDGLDYKSLGRMFSGLAQTGAWSCFDEFNRIEVEVLSVVAQQLMSILNAISEGATRFLFEGFEIKLVPTCGVFITMNPGYAGRSELPDNLKSLFRPVSMMVPDSMLIAEIMLFSEGFTQAKALSKKLTSCYQLSIQQLSKQDHYDFGLRSIRSVLNMAGGLKRSQPDAPEDVVLLRTLRDMNLPKFVSQDVSLFLAILGDLFPGIEPPVAEYGDLQTAIEAELVDQGLQLHEPLINKVLQLYETKQTRHGVMVVGQTGSGKSVCWRTLQRALTRLKKEGKKQYHQVRTHIVNPKAVAMSELYGGYDLNTREWTDGILSSIMRAASADERPDQKWIIFDGPVDTLWIESMNTVLDDNKMLTLNNGERISMPAQVSLLFEVQDLACASPATVSRCGMIYLDHQDMGWAPFVESWLAGREEEEVVVLRRLLEKYVQPTLDFRRKECTSLVAVTDLNAVQSLCALYNTLAVPENGVQPGNADFFARMVELWFLFAVIWSIGASNDEESRKKLDMFLREIEGQFPSKDTVYEYFVDPKKKGWALWEEKIPTAWRVPPNMPFFKVMVPTVDTVRNNFLISTLIKAKRNVLLVGATGTGKTSLVHAALATLDESYTQMTVNFSSQTTSARVQEIIESKVEKRTKDVYVPKGGKNMVVFIDDLNMPQREVFGAQPPLELLRQWIDYGFWYDRQKQVPKFIKDTQLVAAMGPPGGGRSHITPRLQSRFHVINVTFPHESQIKRIYGTMISQKLADFEEEVKSIGGLITQATVDIYRQVSEVFLPTPAKSHYLFNLRDISKVTQGVLQAHRDFYDTKESLVKLWVHETYRVFADRLIDQEDADKFKGMVSEKLSGMFDTTWGRLYKTDHPTLFGDFMREGMEVPVYEEIPSMEELKQFLELRLEDYNTEPGSVSMDLVLFRDAIEHICRIHRVLRQQRGNLLLVGVGGSGRQSLTRLAAYIAEMRVFQIEVTKLYRSAEFHEDLKKLYNQAGIENKPTVFLFTDTQVVQESFLEDINNILSSGEVPNLYASDELVAIRDAVRPAAKAAGVPETAEALFAFFIERVRSNLHVVLCMSPIGNGFRNRCRMYPALINCTTLDWFSAWPKEALQEVGARFLEDLDLGEARIKDAIVDLFVTVQTSVVDASARMERELNRHNYVTPTNYLELVTGYRELLTEKRREIGDLAGKLRGGLSKLEQTRVQVQEMSVELEEKKKVVAKSQKDCEDLLVVIVQERRVADEQAKQVSADSKKLSEEERVIQSEADAAQSDLDAALPALQAATKALEGLNKKDLAEVKAYSQPPALVEKVMTAIMILRKSEASWAEAKRQLGDPNFLGQLAAYDKEAISDGMLKKIDKVVADPQFVPEVVGKVSTAARSLCMWVRAMQQYAHVHRTVAPKKNAVRIATEALNQKRGALASAQNKLKELNDKLASLKEKYDDSVSTKERLRRESEETEVKLERADKLVNGLASERERWQASIKRFDQQYQNLVGDCGIGAAFLSYAGAFSSEYRQELVQKKWTPMVRQLNIPCTSDFAFHSFLSKPTEVREWSIWGLPSDAYSTENGVLVTRGRRWPLMIDPQGQANKWVRAMESRAGLKVIDLKQPDFLRTLENAIQFGTPVLLEDVLEELDPSLAPVLNKSVIKRGGSMIMRLGDKEIEYNPEFRLYITTKLANPHYAPEISTKVTLTNFAVKEQGMEQQLLGIVVRKERPDLEEQKDQLVVNMAAGNKRLVELEDKILHLLSSATGSLLDDEQLVETLQSSKTTSEEIKQQLQVAEQTEAKIDVAREAYRPCAKRASILFFVLNDMSSVDPMYQFSLDSYIHLFSMSMDKSPKSDDVMERIRMLNDYHTYATYRVTCRGLFEKHKLLFAFQICVKIMQAAGKLSSEEFQFFLRGGQVLDKDEQMPNPFPDWMPEAAWDNITELEKLANFRNITGSFEQYTRDWNDWFFHGEPERVPLPGEWENKCNELQHMVIVRCLRPDRVVQCVTSFIVNNLNQKYVEPPPFELEGAYADSTTTTPLIFVLSPGVDPTGALHQFAQARGMHDRFRFLALGQGQAPLATKLIEDGVSEGHWVFLANCHLSMSWMPQLEKIIAGLEERELHPEFRLWLSSSPHPRFPISILQRGIKMTTEPPKGLRANLLRLYNNITPEQFARCKANGKYKRLLFILCFFHSVLLERRKFQTLGWNIPYDFNDSDFETSENILALYLDEYEDTPWDALKYLIAEATYGGRVTDDWDRRLLRDYINKWYNDEALDSSLTFKLSNLNTYYIPDDGALQIYKDYINALPSVDRPEAFGQHPNADISSQIKETQAILDTLIGLQPRVIVEGELTPEQRVAALAEQILAQLPDPIDAEIDTTPDSASGHANPLQIVLMQELERYNKLLRLIKQNLTDLVNGLKGLVVMSAELDETFAYLADGRVPPVWGTAYPSLKNLGSWTRDLLQRVQQFSSWADGQTPKVFWLGGFTFPTGFLTALLQQSARKNNVSIDSLTWEFHVLNIDESEVTAPPREGAYIRGLHLEGARWDSASGTLAEPNPMELVSSMPIVHFKPVEARKKVTRNLYTCPCYLYPVRTGTRERPSFMLAVDLKSGNVEPDHWTKRGTALLLSLP